MGPGPFDGVQTIKVADIPHYREWLAAHPGTSVVSVTLVNEGKQSHLLVSYVPPRSQAAQPCTCARRQGPNLVAARLRRRTLPSMHNPA